MKALCAAILGVVVIGSAGVARAEDPDPKKIVGNWEISKAGGDLPVGTTAEFTKDNKLIVLVKMDGMEIKVEGTYKIEKDKLTVKLTVMGNTIEESVTIKKLTDDTLEIEDKDKKIDTLKKKK